MGRSTRCAAAIALGLALTAPAGAGATLRSDVPAPPSTARLRFDAGLGVHVVEHRDSVYYFDRAFLRIHSGRWQSGASAWGPWRPRRAEWVPIRLRLEHFADER